MRLSQLFTKTRKDVSKDEASVNAQLLEKAGFIYKNSAGIYTYLPLGWRVMQKISKIIREEMDAIGGQEMYMPALHDKHYLEATKRWDVDVVYKVISGEDKEPHFNISWTHEEIIAEIAKKYINSYKDLPFSAYQIQTKFRHEPRAKSGLLRGREFSMKDLYSFHADEDDLYKFYELSKKAYFRVFDRCGLKTYCTLAGGSEFTVNNTHEFQALADVGEDTIFYCDKCGYAENIEISKLKENQKCPKCDGKIKSGKSIEVGNIFPLGTKYSEAFGLMYSNKDGSNKYVVMGSYGIGLGRAMGTIVEKYHDENGIIWPEEVAPFQIHIVNLETKNEKLKAKSKAEELYDKLQKAGIEVLYDDRDVNAGQKFADADLIGCPIRIVVSSKTLEKNSVELKRRNSEKVELIKINEILKKF